MQRSGSGLCMAEAFTAVLWLLPTGLAGTKMFNLGPLMVIIRFAPHTKLGFGG